MAVPDPVANEAATPLWAELARSTGFELCEGLRRQAKRCLLDLVGTAAAGVATPLSAIIRRHAAEHFGTGSASARMIFDGRRVSPVGAALAGGMTIDSFDAHDGHALTKGHAGAAVLPGLMAAVDAAGGAVSGEEFLALLALGYEIAIRAGIATHRTAADYHTSGSWNAIGVAAVVSRVLDLDAGRLRHALGIAEYHGPRSQMMRCIDHPTMLKDGSGVGAMTGVSAAYLARDGFTGAPALTVESKEVADLWSDFGIRWRMLEMYFKPYPVCRWAQPAVRAILDLREHHAVDPAEVETLEIETFHEATRLDHPAPPDTETAQYSLPFPAAAALLRGRLEPADVSGAALRNRDVLDLARRVRLVEDAALSARFPAERLARARLRLRSGRVLATAAVPALGDAEEPLSDADLAEKFLSAAEPSLTSGRSRSILATIDGLQEAGAFARFADLVFAPPDREHAR